ncbi:MAG: VWA domain-containing protein [Flavobacteriales bacterium]|nr:VWA domain-containing protein [Flavobacteriales bacterium]MDW8410679.1 VWA domain-containing protein [Flavobacteriales bacterium]
MRFLYPTFLGALALLAIPLIIHLFRFRKYRKIRFSDIVFLRRALTESTRRSRLRHLLMLFLRLTTVAALVVAFAYPLRQGDQFSKRRKYVSIYIDNSLSMDNPAAAGTLLDEARATAEAIMRGFGEGARFLVLAGTPLENGGRFTNLNEALHLAAQVRIAPQSRPLSAVLQRAVATFAAENDPQGSHSIFLISDFQTSQNDLLSAQLPGPIPDELVCVPVQASRTANMAVDSAWLASGLPLAGQQDILHFRCRNYGNTQAEIPAEFFVNGLKKASTLLTIPPGSTAETSFPVLLPERESLWTELRLQDAGASFDNRFFVVLHPSLRRNILVWYEDNPASLLRALSTEPAFSVSSSPLAQADYSAIKKTDVLFLVGIRQWTSGLSSIVRDFLQRGGWVTLFPPASDTPASVIELEKELSLSWPGILQNTEAEVAPPDLHHPFFSGIFELQNERLAMPRTHRWYATFWPGADIILRFTGGQPFLQSLAVGKGRLFGYAVPLDNAWSNLPQHGLFVPLILRTAIQSRATTALYYTADPNSFKEPPQIPAPGSDSSEEPFRWVNAEAPQENFIPAQQRWGNRVVFQMNHLVPPPGVYNIYQGDSLAGVLAWNATGPESNPEVYAPAKLDEILRRQGWEFARVETATPRSFQQRYESRSTLHGKGWFYALLVAALALIGETILSRHWPIKDIIPKSFKNLE